MTVRQDLAKIYIGYFGRAPEPLGLTFWIGVREGGMSLEAIAQDFAGQPEATALYPFLADPANGDADAFIAQVYQNLFNRAPDAAGAAFWKSQLEAGYPVGEFILAVIEGAQAPDTETLANKTEVALHWHDVMDGQDGFTLTPEALANAREALEPVTDDDATVDQGKAIADLFVQTAPSVALSNALTSLSEDTDTTNRVKVADIDITDDGLGTNTLSLSGADAGLFEIDGNALYLKAGVSLDFESDAQFDVTVEVDDASVGSTPDDSAALSLAITDANEAPSVSLTQVVTAVAEGTSVRTKVADVVISDDALGTNTLSLSGADAAMFELDGTELYLKAGVELDFEAAAQLDVSVDVDDASVGSTPDDSAALSLVVTDENEAPSVSLTQVVPAIAEGTSVRTKVADVVISDDALGTNTLALSGADAAMFELDGTELYLKAGVELDFETAAQLDVSVDVDDASVGSTPDDSAALSLVVTDENEAPSVSLTQVQESVSEGTSVRTKVADVVITDDGAGTNTLTLSGADAAMFELDGTELYLKAGVELDFETAAQLDVSVDVDDASVGSTPDDSAALSLAITDVNEAPSLTVTQVVTAVAEGTSVRTKVADVVISDDALGTNTLALSGADAAMFELDGTELYLKAGLSLDFESDPQLDLRVDLSDAALSDTPIDGADLSFAITDENEAPSVSLTQVVPAIAEGTSVRTKVADVVISDDALGTNTLSLSGADAAMFELDGTELYLKAGVELDFETAAQLDVSVDVDDASVGNTPDDSAALSLAITDVNEAPSLKLEMLTAELREDADTSAAVAVARIVVEDDALGTNTLALGGQYAEFFEIVGDEVRVKQGASLSFPENERGDGPLLFVTVDDAEVGDTPDDTAELGLTFVDVADAPVATDDVPKVSEFLINELVEGSQVEPEIAYLAGGGFVVAWRSSEPRQGGDDDSSGIKARIFGDDGHEVAHEFLVNSDGAGSQIDPVITALPDGGFVVAWRSSVGDEDGTCIKARIFKADGTAKGAEMLVNDLTEGDQSEPAITALPNGGFAISWGSSQPEQGDDSSFGIKARFFNANGQETASEFLANDLTEKGQFDSAITALSDGRVVITWRSDAPGQGDTVDTGVKARIFDPSGKESTAEFLVNTVTDLGQHLPDVVGLADGGFVAVWSSQDIGNGDTSGFGVRGRVFNADGSARGDDFLVNQLPKGDQKDAKVELLEDGRFVVVWRSEKPLQGDAFKAGVKARIFEADGTPATDEVLVNELPRGSQLEPDVTAMPGGGFAVVWYSETPLQGDTSETGVKARFFDEHAQPAEAVQHFYANRVDEIPVAQLLENDFDPDGTIPRFDGVVGTSEKGAVLNVVGGKIVYDPRKSPELSKLGFGEKMEDSFTYTIRDADGNTSQATVSFVVEGVNATPTVTLVPRINTVDHGHNYTAPVRVADIVIQDDDVGENQLSLSGEDAGMFYIDGTKLMLRKGVTLDRGTNPTLDVTVEVDDPTVGSTPDDTDSLSIAVRKIVKPPKVLDAVNDYLLGNVGDSERAISFQFESEALGEGFAGFPAVQMLSNGGFLAVSPAIEFGPRFADSVGRYKMPGLMQSNLFNQKGDWLDVSQLGQRSEGDFPSVQSGTMKTLELSHGRVAVLYTEFDFENEVINLKLMIADSFGHTLAGPVVVSGDRDFKLAIPVLDDGFTDMVLMKDGRIAVSYVSGDELLDIELKAFDLSLTEVEHVDDIASDFVGGIAPEGSDPGYALDAISGLEMEAESDGGVVLNWQIRYDTQEGTSAFDTVFAKVAPQGGVLEVDFPAAAEQSDYSRFGVDMARLPDGRLVRIVTDAPVSDILGEAPSGPIGHVTAIFYEDDVDSHYNNASGTYLPIQAPTEGVGTATPRVAVLSNGQIVVTWVQGPADQDGNEGFPQIKSFAAILNPNGTVAVPAFEITQHDDLDMTIVSGLTALEDGGFAVSYKALRFPDIDQNEPVYRRAGDYDPLETEDGVFDVTRIFNQDGSPRQLKRGVSEDDMITVDLSELIANDIGTGLEIIAVSATSAHGAMVELDTANGLVRYDASASDSLQEMNIGDETLDTFTYTLRDDKGNTDTATVTVRVFGNNDRPEVVDALLESRVWMDMATNPSLTTSLDLNSFISQTTDVDNTQFYLAEGSGTSEHGAKLVFNADGTVDYTADASDVWEQYNDSFTYWVIDADGHASNGTIEFSVFIEHTGGGGVNGYPPIDEPPVFVPPLDEIV